MNIEQFAEISKKYEKAAAGIVIATSLFFGGSAALANGDNSKTPIKSDQGNELSWDGVNDSLKPVVLGNITIKDPEAVIGDAVFFEPKVNIGDAVWVGPDYYRSPFTDIYGENFSLSYRIAAEFLWENNIVSGYVENGRLEFKPEASAKRGQVAKMLINTLKLLGVTPEDHQKQEFNDVEKDNPFYSYINQGVKMGLLKGSTNGNFEPYDNATRAQVTTILVRAANVVKPGIFSATTLDFKGELSPEQYLDGAHGDDIKTAEYHRILKDLEGFDKSWDSNKEASRAETARMITNFYYGIKLILDQRE